MADIRDPNTPTDDIDDDARLVDKDVFENDQLLFDEDQAKEEGLVPDEAIDDVDDIEFSSGREKLIDKLREHHSKSPELSSGDIDADWERADSSGEETVGSTVATPDQSVVDDLGQAVGVTYEDDEPLDTEDKIAKRDKNRWELNPASADERDERDPQDLDGEEI